MLCNMLMHKHAASLRQGTPLAELDLSTFVSKITHRSTNVQVTSSKKTWMEQ